MDSASSTALVRLMEAMSIQIGELTKEVGELRGMLSAWELDRERISQQRDDMHEIRDTLSKQISSVHKSVETDIARQRGEVNEAIAKQEGQLEGLKTRQMTTAIAIILVGVVSLGNQWPSIVRLLV